MRLESTARHVGLIAVATSAAHAFLRRTEEVNRRASSSLIQLLPDGAGGCVECVIGRPVELSSPVVVFETGLGACFEGWDWLAQLLAEDHVLVRYHRSGHGRTRSRLRPSTLLTHILDQSGLGDRRINFVGHSLGGLVIANSLHESPALVDRAATVTLIDSTDAELLGQERADPEKVRRFRQYCFQEGLAAVTGLGRWTVSPVESEVNFRASIQRAFLTESSRPRTLLTAVREHVREPLVGQSHLAALTLPKLVLSASDNSVQQRLLADKLGARFEVIPDSSHRAVIGRIGPASAVARHVREVAQ